MREQLGYDAVRQGTGWHVTVLGEERQSIYLTYNQYGRFLAWLDTTFSIDVMFPELTDKERHILLFARGDPPLAFVTNT